MFISIVMMVALGLLLAECIMPPSVRESFTGGDGCEIQAKSVSSQAAPQVLELCESSKLLREAITADKGLMQVIMQVGKARSTDELLEMDKEVTTAHLRQLLAASAYKREAPGKEVLDLGRRLELLQLVTSKT